METMTGETTKATSSTAAKNPEEVAEETTKHHQRTDDNDNDAVEVVANLEEKKNKDDDKNSDSGSDEDHAAPGHVGSRPAVIDSLMDASDNIMTSLRTAVESIEPPMPFFTRPKQRQRWEDIQVSNTVQ